MNSQIISFLLVLLIEGICTLVSYLKERLMDHMSCKDDAPIYERHQEYA